jgi:tetratricopeptide (TPR) repeat protein
MFILLGLSVLIAVAVAWWILITPDNPLTSLFGRQNSDVIARIIIGPYPAESDFRLLKQNNVGLVVSLLDPVIPYEATLLEREKALAAQYQIPVESYPMSSILGQKFGNDYDESAAKAAAAIAGTTAKVYLHCYLGQHRIQAVRTILAAKGIVAGTYAIRTGERAEAAKQLDMAEAAYNKGQYGAALAILVRIEESQLTDNADALGGLGPTYYRAGRQDDAIRRLSEAPAITPGNHELRDALARAEASK